MFDLLLNEPEPESIRQEDEFVPASLIRLPSMNLHPPDIMHGLPDESTLPILSDVFISPLPWESVWRIPRSRELDNLPGQTNLNADQVGASVGAQSRSIGKKVSTLSEVLNTEQPSGVSVVKRKRSRGADEARKLPRPSSPRRQTSGRQPPQPLLPPLLAPLYEPPPNARLVPSINTETYGDGFGASSFPHPRLGSPTVDDWHVTTINQEEAFQVPFTSSAEVEPVIQVVQCGDAPQLPEEPARSSEINVAEASRAVEIAPSSPKLVQSSETGKRKRQHRRWSEEETRDLLEGVKRYGIGSWKKILAQSDLHFQNRTAVDLKDRFRTCYPDQYLKRPRPSDVRPEATGSALPEDPPGQQTSTKPSIDANRPLRDQDKAPAIVYPKRLRRDRQMFSATEDDALLRGFRKHKAKWNKIRLDPDLQLSHRSRTDLRDRFRNKFTAIFKQAGYSTNKPVKEDESEERVEADTSGTVEDAIVAAAIAEPADKARKVSPSEERLKSRKKATTVEQPPNVTSTALPASQPDAPILDLAPTGPGPDPVVDAMGLSLLNADTRPPREDWIAHLGQMDISSLLASEETSAPPLQVPLTVLRMSDILNDPDEMV